MKVAILEGPKNFVIRELPLPEPNCGEVRIKVMACGVCHSEMPVWEGKFGNYPARIGHEVSGIVDKLGEGVQGLRVGDAVTIYTNKQGYSEYLTVGANFVIPLGPNVSFQEALGEPIGCVVNGVRRAGISHGDTVVLVGVGFMGLIMLQMITGQAGRIIVIDPREEALKLAKELGAHTCINPAKQDPEVVVKQLTKDEGADVVIELTGNQKGLDLATVLTKIRGRLVIFGFHVGERTINMFLWNWRGLDVVNAHERDPLAYLSGIQGGMKLLEAGVFTMKPLLTHQYSLDEIGQAFITANNRDEGFVKAIVCP